MGAWGLLNANGCCYSLTMSAQPLLRGYLPGSLPEEGTNNTSILVLQCWMYIQPCIGREEQCSHQTIVGASYHSSVRAHTLPILHGCQAGPFLWPQRWVLHHRGGCYSLSLCPVSSRRRRRGLISYVWVQSRVSTLQQSPFSLSRLLSDKARQLELPYI